MDETGPIADWLRDRLDALLALLRAFAQMVADAARHIEAAVEARVGRIELKLELWLGLFLVSFLLIGWLNNRKK